MTWYRVMKPCNMVQANGTKRKYKPGEMIDVVLRGEETRLRKRGVIGRQTAAQAALEGPRENKMALHRVLKKFTILDQRKRKVEMLPGQIVDILTIKDEKRLSRNGYIASYTVAEEVTGISGTPAEMQAVTKRVGIWLRTSMHYSGGRVHMYQYALSLCDLGCEVWLITNSFPRWANDYPGHRNLHIVTGPSPNIPPDLDLIVTDSKGGFGQQAWDWCKKFPRVPFIGFNFETPNWVSKFVPDYARKLHSDKDVFKRADLLISNSAPSAKYLKEWLGQKQPGVVLPPAVNTTALMSQNVDRSILPQRPYAVYSARGAKYKGGGVAIKAVWGMTGIPFDLVVFGRVNRPPGDTQNHKMYALDGRTDAEKFFLMKHAQMVLAPSKFEGYGMVPGEALASGTPCVVYDLPVLRKAYGDKLQYVKWGDEAAFCRRVQALVKKPKRVPAAVQKKIVSTHGMVTMRERVDTIPYHHMRKPHVSAHMIAYWGVVPEAIESVYPYVDEINIAYGPTKVAKSLGAKPDRSLEYIQEFKDPDKKINLCVKPTWADKAEMRNWCVKKLYGNYHLMLDGDEIWVGLDQWIDAKVKWLSPRWVNFWHSKKHWIYDTPGGQGRRWGHRLNPYGSPCPHYRWSWWRNSFYFKKHHTVTDQQGNGVHRFTQNVPAAVKAIQDKPLCVIYHLGHMLSKATMQAKHDFYLKRDGVDKGRKARKKIWHNWKGKTGNIGDGIVEEVKWDLPAIVSRGCKALAK